MKLLNLLINAYKGRKCTHTTSGYYGSEQHTYMCGRTGGHYGEHLSALRLLNYFDIKIPRMSLDIPEIK